MISLILATVYMVLACIAWSVEPSGYAMWGFLVLSNIWLAKTAKW
jgi:hypothetical protein